MMATDRARHIAQELMAPGQGILVLDEHVEDTLRRAPGSDLDGAQLARWVVGSDAFDAPLSGLLVLPEILATLTPVRSTGPRLGVRIGPSRTWREGHTVADRPGPELRDRADFVELRFGRRVTETPMGDATVDVAHLADAAIGAHELGLATVVTVAAPDLGTHSAAVTRAVTANALRAVFAPADGIDPAATIVRTNAVVPGGDHPAQFSAEHIARATLDLLVETLPDDLAGVALLSGGFSLTRATEMLRETNRLVLAEAAPWPVTFAYGRALVEPDANGEITESPATLSAACGRAAHALPGSRSAAPAG